MNIQYGLKTCLSIVFALLFLSTQKAYTQCNLKPIHLQERIQQSKLIVEGIVIGQRSLWDNPHHNIYTIYTVDVLSVFKGNLSDTLVYIVAPGGVVDMEMHRMTHSLELNEGKAGIFTLIPTNDPVSANTPLYEAYAATQGFIKYEKSSREAVGVFDKYSNIETDLYGKIKAHTHSYKRNKSIPWNKVTDQSHSIRENAVHHHDHNDGEELHFDMNSRLMNADTLSATNSSPISASATITSFSPTTIEAGTFTQLTINGSGFGATQGSSYVQFPNADAGGSSYITPIAAHYISWSDTKIVVEVPTQAGTGKFKVSDGTNTVTASTSLTVDYAILNLNSSASGTNLDYRANHINANTTGGYTFQMYTGFDANASAKADFQNLVYQWRCATGINWIFGATTTTNTTASDGLNVVRFDVGSELSAGVLGLATSRFSGCIIGANVYWYVSEVDVQVDDGTNFFYGSSGSPSASQYDFWSVMLHEMGHAHQLGHVIDATKVMHYSLSNGAQKRTISSSELTGASWQLAQSIAAGTTCSKTVHIDYSCNPSVTLSVGATSIAETGGTTTVTATLSKRNFSDVTVNLSLSGTATTTTDYTLATSILIPTGSLSASITLASVSDVLYEGNETVIADISSVTNGTESGTQQQTVTITDDDAAPTVTLSTGVSSIAETAGSTTVTATLSAASGLATTVNLTFTGTATVTTDYTLLTSITIPAGNTSASITLASVSDTKYEGNETVIIDISTVTNGTESGTQQQTVTITDDDTAPTVTLSTGVASIAETAGSTTVTATLSAASGLATTVNLAFTGTAIVTTDYTLLTSITIPAGSTSASITLASVSDALYEGNETVIIDISTVTNGTESGTQQKTVTITDDETAPTVTLSTGASTIAETSGSTTVTATLSAASGLTTTVNLAFTGTATVTSDYTLLTSITVPAGSTSASITLASVSDLLYEGNETVIIDISTVTNGTESGTQQKTVTITDDETSPTVTLSTGGTSIAETAGSTTVTATLSAASGLATTVNLAFTGTATVTTDYTLLTSITIPAGSTSASITLASVSDVLYEGNETVIIDISTVTNGTESGTQQQTVTITDDDSAPIATLSTGGTSIAETSGSTTVTATLSTASGLATTVNLAFTGTATVTSDYTLLTSITVPAGSTSASITLASVSDLLYEGNETVIIDISTVTNGTESGTQQKTVTITDDDTAPTVTLSTGVASIAETAGSATVTATLSAASGLATTVNLAFTGTAIVTTDYTLLTSITIPAGSTSASITLASVSDVLYEGNETVIIDISTVTNGTESGTQQQTVTITDDETAPTVTLSTGVATIAETSGSTTVTATLSAVSGLATTVNLSFTGTATVATDYTLATSILIPAGSTSASITLASVSDVLYEGNETVIIDISTVTNGTESGTQQQTVTITDDETAPTVTLSTGVATIAETSGSTTVTTTLSAVSGLATTVNLSFTGTATVATDYTLATSILIPAGSTSASITLTSVSDVLYEGNETVIIDISTVTNGTESGTQQQTVTITDDETAPTVTLSTGSSTVLENAGTTTVTATISAVSALATTINLSFSGTATVTTDYTLATSIIIPAGSISASVTLASVTDALIEGDETLIIDISTITNGTESGTQQQTITIIDNPLPTVTLSTGVTSIAETAGSTTVIATLSSTYLADVTVNLSMSGTATIGADYTLTTSIVVPAGSTSASITLASVSDVLYEGNETVIIDISAITNGIESGIQQSTVMITDDDSAPIVTLSTGGTSITETSGSTTVTATLSAVSGLATTVNLSFSGTATVTSDYTLPTSIVVPAGSTSASITLASVSDVLYEGNETVIIDISTVTNGTESGTQQKTVTITDDDSAPTVTLSTGGTSITETSGSTTVTATLSAASGLATTVNLTFTGTATVTSDYTLPTSIVVPAGSTSASITLASVSDVLYEGNETVIIDISTVNNGTESGTQQKTVTITDDETAPTVTLSTGGTSIAETSGSTTVTATLSAVSGLAMTVNLSFTGTATVATDYTLATSIVVPAGSTSASITLTSVSDVLYEGNETVIIDISTVTNGTESGTQQSIVTITEDDLAPFVFLSATPLSIAENTGTSIITATLSTVSGIDVTVDLAYSGTATYGSDYAGTVQILIPAGSTTGSLTVASIDDATDDDNETIIVDINAVSNGTENTPQQVTVIIIDDENPEINIRVSSVTVANNSNYNFGNITVGSSSTVHFTVENLGTGQLNLTNSNLVVLSGTNVSDYILDKSLLNASIAPGGSSDFSITFNSTCGSVKTAQFTVSNDDADEGSYTVIFSATPTETVVPVADIAVLPTITSSCAVTLTAPTATDNCSGALTGTTADPIHYSTVGSYTVTWTYTDLSGNASTQIQQVIIQADLTVPQIICPANIVSTTPTVTYVLPVATDNCSTPLVTLTSGLASGAVFPYGTTTVTYTATDLAGNTAVCSFTVTVNQDLTPTMDASETIFKMYPNPVSDYVILENIPSTEILNVFDNKGILVMSKDHVSNKEIITLSDWTQGVYMVQLVSGTKVNTYKLEVIK
jgi:hypothetical protein